MVSTTKHQFEIGLKDKTKAAVDKMRGRIDKTAKSSKNLEKNIKSLDGGFMKMAKSVGALFVVDKLKDSFFSLSAEFQEFDNQMRMVNTINRQTDEDFSSFSDGVRELAEILPQTTKEIGDSLFYVASAGVEVNQQMDILTVSSAAALASGSDMKTVFDGMSATIKGFGMEFADAAVVMDNFFKINELGQTTVGDVSTAMQRVASLAKAAGVSFDEVSAVFATFTGVTGNAAEVSTQLRGAINALASPTREAKKRFDALGVEVGQAAIEEKGFAGVAKEVFEAVNGNTEALRQLIPEVEANLLITALATGQSETYNQKLGKIQDSKGALKRATIEMAKSEKFQMDIMRASIEDFKLSFGEAFTKVMFHTVNFGKGVFKMGKLVLQTFSTVINSAWNFAKTLGQAVGAGIAFMIDAITNGFDEAQANFNENFTKNLLKNMESVSSGIEDLESEFSSLMDFIDNPASEAQENYAEKLQESIEALEGQRSAVSDLAEEQKAFSGEFDFGKLEISKNIGASQISRDLESLGSQYETLYDSAKNELKSLEKAHSDNTERIKGKIDDIKASLKELETAYEGAIAGFDQALGSQVVEQENKIKKLKESLAAEDDADKKSALVDQIAKEEKALREFMENTKGLDDEIAEARRRASLTEFERFVEDIEKKRDISTEEFERKKSQLEEGLAQEDANLEAEEVIYQQKRGMYLETLSTFESMVDGIGTGLATMRSNTEMTVDEMKAKLYELKATLQEIKALTAPTDGPDKRTLADVGKQFGAVDPTSHEGGGVFDPRPRAMGGRVEAGEFYRVGERGPETFRAPRSGFIEPTGGRGLSGVTVQVNVTGNNIDSSSRVDEILQKAERMFTRKLELLQKGIAT
jgi:TP901 family phage tail tape measure protein